MTLLADGRLTKQPVADTSWPFFRLAFRPFFWLGALFGAVSIALWALSFSGHIDFSPYGGSYFWHVHEMLFGFVVAIIVGFLLTAVKTWTGLPAIKGMPLALLVGTWLAARVLLALEPSTALPTTLVTTLKTAIMVDLLFLPMAAMALAVPILTAKQWRNLFFVPILLAMAALNGLTHLAVAGAPYVSFVSIGHIMVLLVSLVICVMAGRLLPMFTANGTGTAAVAPIGWLEKLSITSVGLSILVAAHIVDTPAAVDAAVYLATGLVNFVRALRWKIWITLATPLVWPLHVSYWAICVGFTMLGLVKLELLTDLSAAYHAITVGGISFMILAMISRVSLGHTGRDLQVGPVMTSAFVLLVLAFAARVLGPQVVGDYSLAMLLSATLWVLAYGLFVARYSFIVFTARIDGVRG